MRSNVVRSLTGLLAVAAFGALAPALIAQGPPAGAPAAGGRGPAVPPLIMTIATLALYRGLA